MKLFSKELYNKTLTDISEESGLSVKEIKSRLKLTINEFIESITDGKLSIKMRDNLLYVYYYKASKHYVLNGFEKYEYDDVLDTRVFDMLKDMVTFDISFRLPDGKMVDTCVQVWPRELSSSVKLGSKVYDILLKVDFAQIPGCYTFALASSPNVKQLVFAARHCVYCIEKCKQVGVYTILPRRKADVCFQGNLPNSFTILKTILVALNTVMSAPKLVKTVAGRKVLHNSKIHVASTPVDSDIVTVASLVDYNYTYKESKPYTYKGGHHKSPVPHSRHGYFRKSRCGDHVLINDEFVPVKKGTGTFTWVEQYRVNMDKEGVKYEVVK